MTEEQLLQLARRRAEIVKNMEYCERALSNAQNKVHEYEDEIATGNEVLNAIDHSLQEHLSEEQPEIKAYSCFDANNEETVMLKIQIPGFKEPIFKVLDRMDFALYMHKETIIDEMAFRGRMIELAMQFLNEQKQITRTFENISRGYLTAPRIFANSRIVENRIMGRRY
jgi:hypothetical protein